MENSDNLKRTPLYECHKKLQAKFTPFGGWDMPVLYSGIIEEHNTVRSAAGLFDVSHMGEIFVEGPEAYNFLQYISTNDLSLISDGGAQYSLLLNEKGGVVDDIIIYRFNQQKFLVCVNAGNTEKDWKWFNQNNYCGAKLTNSSSEYSQIAIQGPKAESILTKVLKLKAEDLIKSNFPYFTFKTYQYPAGGQDVEIIVARTGYTGEDGFELFIPNLAASDIWQSSLENGEAVGIRPIGLGARDTLRLEASYPLHGHELSDDISALSCGVSWAIKIDKKVAKGDFLGKQALVNEKAKGVKYKLVGLETVDKGIVRDGCKVFATSGEELGWTSSGTKTPTLNKSIALAFVASNVGKVGEEVNVDVRGKMLRCKVIPKPFYKIL